MRRKGFILKAWLGINIILLPFLSGWKMMQGEFAWNKTTHDFGTILRGESYSYQFTFTNSGDEPILIKNVVSENPAWKAEWPQAAVKPLQTGFIKVILKPIIAGNILSKFSVYSNAKTAITDLWVEGEVLSQTDNKSVQKSLGSQK